MKYDIILQTILMISLITIVLWTNYFVKIDSFDNTNTVELDVTEYLDDDQNIIDYLDANINRQEYNLGEPTDIDKQNVCYKGFYNNTGYNQMKECRDILIDNQILKCKSNKYVNYINKSKREILNKNERFLKALENEPERLLNRHYIQEFLKYQDAKRQSELNHPLADEFANIPAMNSLNSEVLEEESLKILYPSIPRDFYGEYQVRQGQFKILDGIHLILEPSTLYINDQEGKTLKKFKISDMNKAELPKYPTTTIEVTLEDLRALDYGQERQYIKKDEDEEYRERQRQLLNELGLTYGNVYLYGNDGNYRLYNYHKMLVFHLDRLSVSK